MNWFKMAQQALQRLEEIRDELRGIRELLDLGAVTPQRRMTGTNEAFGPRETTR